MAERIDLTTPDQVAVGTSDYHVAGLSLAWEGPGGAAINVSLVAANGLRRSFVYEGAVATALMVALNKADLSVKSLQRRILERLVADGKLAGAVAGQPD